MHFNIFSIKFDNCLTYACLLTTATVLPLSLCFCSAHIRCPGSPLPPIQAHPLLGSVHENPHPILTQVSQHRGDSKKSDLKSSCGTDTGDSHSWPLWDMTAPRVHPHLGVSNPAISWKYFIPF